MTCRKFIFFVHYYVEPPLEGVIEIWYDSAQKNLAMQTPAKLPY